MRTKSPSLLIILDGYGCRKEKKYNAIANATKPNLDFFCSNYPSTIIKAAGRYVGMPEGYIGNSEVGHLTIGAGRIIPQPIIIINEAIKDGTFFKNKKLLSGLSKLNNIHGRLHIMGLLSDAGVHSIEKHLFAYLKAAIDQNIKQIFVHPFLDGRDVAPKSAENYLSKLDKFIKKYDFIKIGTIHGRYYAMDRDNNWDRTEKSYKVLTEKQKIKFKNWSELINYYYSKNVTDEFVPPTQLDSDSIIDGNDGVIFFNYRPDRARQITSCFVQKKTTEIKLKKIKLTFFITPVSYGKQLKTNILFHEKPIKNTLMDILSKYHYKSLSIAETEKYAHVTYFFRGGREKLLSEEKEKMVPSIKVKTYIKYPCMSAPKITKYVINCLKKNLFDFYLINYANPDMVGHSGNYEATVKAIECVDEQLGEIYREAVVKKNGTIYITADHGNAEIKFNEKTGQPSKAHTKNPVPFIFINKKFKDKKIDLPLKGLADIKNFILKNLKIKND